MPRLTLRTIQRLAASIWILALIAAGAAADPVTVRFPDGTTHGFLVLRSLKGQTLAHGELLAFPHGDRMESRLTWRFRDGSLQEEIVTYLQKPALKLLTYKQVQRGPSFPADVEVSVTRAPSHYEMTLREKSKKEPETSSGTIELPDDVYNGLLPTVLNNVAKGETAAGHMVAFTPKARLVKMTIRAIGEDPILVGESRRTAVRYLVDLEVGGIVGVFAKVAGKEPQDLKFWILKGEVPAFVGFEGPFFYQGPVWRIELSAPRWPK